LCGSFCSLCYTQDATPICIACNKSTLIQLISTITGYIKDFYGISDLELRSLENFNTSKNDCFLCPLGCNGCDQNTILADPLQLYAAKCYRCKKLSDLGVPVSSAISNFYEWRLDPENNTCRLCLKSDSNCKYKLETEIFATCGSKEQTIGEGSLLKPINLQRADEVDWDSLLINNAQYLKAQVIMNELGLSDV